MDYPLIYQASADFPCPRVSQYVGKQVANLTLAQIKTLDCGSQRIDGFP